jgi:hypothetical protein
MLYNDFEDKDDVLYKDYVIVTCDKTSFHFQLEYYTKPGNSDGWFDFVFEYVQRDSFAKLSIEICNLAVLCGDCGHWYCDICLMCPCDECALVMNVYAMNAS